MKPFSIVPPAAIILTCIFTSCVKTNPAYNSTAFRKASVAANPLVTARSCPVPNVTVSTRAGSGTGGVFEVDGLASIATIPYPESVAIDYNAGVVYFANSGGIRKLYRTSGTFGLYYVTTLAGSTSNQIGYVDGTGAAARFTGIGGIALDRYGNLIVADIGNNAIRKVTPAGVVTTIAGGNGPGMVDGPIANAKFNGPMDIAVDSISTDIFVEDHYNGRIRRIKQQSQVWTVAGGPGGIGSGPETGPALTIRFNGLTKIDYNSSTGELLIADGKKIKSLQSGFVSIVATVSGIFDGNLGYIRHDNAGNIYTTATGVPTTDPFYMFTGGPWRIIQYSRTTGSFSNIAGGDTPAAFFVDGRGADARFRRPRGIAVWPDGSIIYVADADNQRLRRIELTCPL